MKYRVLYPALTVISQGEFHANIENGIVELPDDLAHDLLAIGMIAPIEETAEDDGLRQPERHQSRARKQRDD